ncbi:hypothetical protein WN943_021842 [Citrus x changshan-huyou]
MAGFPLLLPPIFLPRYLFKYIELLDLCNKLRILNMLHGAGLLFTSQLAVIEMIYKKVYCYSMVMEIVATALSTVEMASDCGAGGLLLDNYRQCGDVVVLLHGYCGDGVLDVVVDRRDLHDDDFGRECYRRVVVYGDSFGGVWHVIS